MINTKECVFEEKCEDGYYGWNTVYYFVYPKEGMNEIDFYPESDYGNVVFTCISLTILDDGSYYMQMSPTVEDDNCYSDVDWRDLFPGINYGDDIVRKLIKIANKEKN